MKILHYYWTQPDEKVYRGGGVQVYLQNLIKEQIQEHMEVFTLSSGVSYSFFHHSCFIKRIKSDGYLKQFAIYNSPVLAPSKAGAGQLQIYMNNSILKNVFHQFIEEYGPFDVIHFHSLEGLSLSVLELKTLYPKTVFLYTMHNYFLFCPQVNLWAHGNSCCTDYHDGHCCTNCFLDISSGKTVKLYYMMIDAIKHIYGKPSFLNRVNTLGRCIYRKTHSIPHSRKRMTIPLSSQENILKKAAVFRIFRNKNIEYINTYMDSVICVSKRVRDISIRMGLRSGLFHVLYIGTAFSENQFLHPSADIYECPFSISYIGYMRRDKGFYFFMDALEKMDIHISSQIKVIIAARNEYSGIFQDIQKLRSKFYDISYYDGYNHQNLSTILTGCHLGVVPVLWEDNMPQVAMEYKALGIPVIASDRGGASELTSAPEFCFRAGDIDDFIRKVTYIIKHKDVLYEYYKHGLHLCSMKEHEKLLKNIYEGICERYHEKA